jgi:hypothetical protein
MDEDEFKEAYYSVNLLRCPFEKALLSTQCACTQSTRTWIAERQAAGCASEAAQRHCLDLIDLLHRNAAFALHQTAVKGALPHAREMKVQCGGLRGLQAVLHPESAEQENVTDIHGLVRDALDRFGSLGALPYGEVVKAIAAYQGRPRRGTRR